ncbi:hypothetical protein HDU67_004316 [Dinochytrium kinnereticum]|nr:hypothetical protein HDU67_004316 [Dinochytrium kinnereticum]
MVISTMDTAAAAPASSSSDPSFSPSASLKRRGNYPANTMASSPQRRVTSNSSTASPRHIPFSYDRYQQLQEKKKDLTAKSILRTLFLPRIHHESHAIASIQSRCSQSLLAFMTSLGALGTHAAFMLMLPPMFWFDVGEDGGAGLREFGRGFVICLLFGVYFSAAVKDFLCLPRPLSPPVRRMTTKASIAFEYGFPSTHTMNATSIALHTILQIIFGSITLASAARPSADMLLGNTFQFACLALLAFYPVLMGLSRIVTGMHSFVDVVGGWWLGAGVVGIWWGGVGAWVEDWVARGSNVPVITITLLILSIYAHPNPDGPCPCFEDSVAAISVVAGVIIGTWRHGPYGDGTSKNNTTIISGALRLVLGVIVMYTFRKLAKLACKRVFSQLLGTPASQTPPAPRGVTPEAHSHEGDCGEEKVYVISRVTVGTLTDGIVYGGIGFLAVDILPVVFGVIGI